MGMLVLRRKRGERIAIDGGAIWVTYLGAEGERAVIGIEAPKEIDVHREEVQQRVDKERGVACQAK